MFQRILVAVDNSQTSQQAFEEALVLARATGGKLLLVHVLSSDEEGAPRLPISPILDYYPVLNDRPLQLFLEDWTTYEQQGVGMLETLLDRVKSLGIPVESRQLSGNPGRLICELAREWQADLIVTGRRGRTGISEFVLGSVSNYVMHHGPCSVLVVNH